MDLRCGLGFRSRQQRIKHRRTPKPGDHSEAALVPPLREVAPSSQRSAETFAVDSSDPVHAERHPKQKTTFINIQPTLGQTVPLRTFPQGGPKE